MHEYLQSSSGDQRVSCKARGIGGDCGACMSRLAVQRLTQFWNSCDRSPDDASTAAMNVFAIKNRIFVYILLEARQDGRSVPAWEGAEVKDAWDLLP